MRALPAGIPPRNPFPLLPLRNGVLFPGTQLTLPMGRPQSVAMAQALKPGDIIGMAVQKDPRTADPAFAELFGTGVWARVTESYQTQRGPRLVVEGLLRFSLEALVSSSPYWTARGTTLPDVDGDPDETRALADALRGKIADLLPRVPAAARDVLETLAEEDDPSLLADRAAGVLGLSTEREVQILECAPVVERLRRVLGALAQVRAAHEVKQKIDEEVREEFGKHQREAILREQLRAIRKELGEDGADGDNDLDTLRKRVEEAGLPPEARDAVDRDLKRLAGMGGQGPEVHVIRTWLDWVVSLPWNKRAEATDDIKRVREKLDADHTGLTEVKRRILEHLAVLKRGGNRRGTILCLAGPPGVGKTSLGQSIADAMGRPFLRVALGGVRDEAEIRGHRRTYVGALPGRILHALKKAKVKNPVFLLDEVDKLAQGWQGNPEAALLEVLDPEQNKTFQDHYLELPFDLSEVLFIATANDLSQLSAPLRDRLEVIEISGYTVDEKVAIARKHLVPRALREHALGEEALSIPDGALRAIISGYTRESGVRQLTREIARLCRSLTLELAEGEADSKAPLRVVEEADLRKPLGRPKFHDEVAERTSVPGVATGLAWTPMGGDILFIETTRMRGKGGLEITGQLGDVMKESARAALAYVRTHAREYGVDEGFLEGTDIHIHVPAGGVPKDGPSAGVTMFTALTSLLSGRRVRPDTAMTGECTLRGRVLPVGGIKEKVLAAHRAGIKRVVLPARNERDVEDVPAAVRREMTFLYAEEMATVLAEALEALPGETRPGRMLDDAPLAAPVVEPAEPLRRPEHLA